MHDLISTGVNYLSFSGLYVSPVGIGSGRCYRVVTGLFGKLLQSCYRVVTELLQVVFLATI